MDLSFNKFLGDITHSQLSSLTSLEYLSLSNNYFNPITFSLFSNLTNLKVLLFDFNKIVPETNNSETWTPTFQLKVFRMSQCLFNEPKRTPPRFLRYQYDLQVIDLSHNNLTGNFPIWLLDNNPKLEFLYLRNNSFTGPFLLPSHSLPKIRRVDISNNYLEGPIPTNLDSILPNLKNLFMSRNAFQGSIPSSFGNLVSLEVLDLSNNHLSGTMPENFTMGCSSLTYLKLSKNNFSGQIFPTNFNLTNLFSLYLDNNHFSGKIPNSLSSNHLLAIDFSNNNLSGKLPRWLGNMSSLNEISMAENLLEGHIPIELCQIVNLMFIELSNNNLFGSIPSCFNSSGIKHVHLKKNRLSGPISTFQNCYSLVTLNLRDNYLTGNIPDWIGNLSSLSILLLKANLLEGRIPIQLCLLHSLSMLDLSYNNFFGPIPHCLSDITFEAANQKSDLGGSFYYEDSVEKPLDYLERKIGNMRDTSFYRAFPLYFSAFPLMDAKQEVEFTTKSRTYSYAGDILNYMSGIDLSCNKLAGENPPELGSLGNIHALNLSHNNLTGPIPTTFSNLKEIESLDLSYNNLNGRIPPQLIELTYLAVFSVAYNNFSGPTPDRKAQFGTFDERSYVGNSLLCGPPLHNSCTKTEPPFTMPVNHRGEEGGGFIDIDVFYISFVVAYIMMLLGIVVVLYINPHWGQAWFNFIEECIDTCYCFVLIHCRKLSNFRLV